MTELTTIDTNNYAEMAKAMGIANEAPAQNKQGIFLSRLRLNHSPILGAESILVKAGTYKLEIPDGQHTTLSLLLCGLSCNASCIRSL